MSAAEVHFIPATVAEGQPAVKLALMGARLIPELMIPAKLRLHLIVHIAARQLLFVPLLMVYKLFQDIPANQEVFAAKQHQHLLPLPPAALAQQTEELVKNIPVQPAPLLLPEPAVL